jgi:hypothetical protein
LPNLLERLNEEGKTTEALNWQQNNIMSLFFEGKKEGREQKTKIDAACRRLWVNKISILSSQVKRQVEKHKYGLTPYIFKWHIPLYRKQTLQSQHTHTHTYIYIYIFYREYIFYIYKYKSIWTFCI